MTEPPDDKQHVTKALGSPSKIGRLSQDCDVTFQQVQNWIKCVAVFMLAFLAFDVSAPERCQAEIAPPAGNSQTLIQSQQNPADSDSDCCSFEEDCFNCAHFAPGHSFTLGSIAVVEFAQADLNVACLDRPPVLPYHPPRA